MKCVRFIADIMAVAQVEDVGNRAARRRYVNERMANMEAPVFPLIVGLFAGPETIGDELLDPGLLDDIRGLTVGRHDLNAQSAAESAIPLRRYPVRSERHTCGCHIASARRIGMSSHANARDEGSIRQGYSQVTLNHPALPLSRRSSLLRRAITGGITGPACSVRVSPRSASLAMARWLRVSATAELTATSTPTNDSTTMSGPAVVIRPGEPEPGEQEAVEGEQPAQPLVAQGVLVLDHAANHRGYSVVSMADPIFLQATAAS